MTPLARLSLRARLSLILLPWLGSGLLRLVAGTIRRQDVGREHPQAILAKGERAIAAFWHGRLLLMPFVLQPHVAATMISQHRDGEYIARITLRLGHPVVRGSATRGGARAFREMLQILEEGGHVAITPDGPRGPARRVKPGVIELSRLSGMPILPVAFGASPAVRLRSWDNLLIPYPFARGVYVWGEPLRVPPELKQGQAEVLQALLETRLNALTAEADRLASCGRGRT
ncbi:MAG: lysophospholipid acyltransferase family protein [candidate division NC10 bacterium]|nr:lysophospholipid acyltransferase family protein [candidate division NC10 bacterium]